MKSIASILVFTCGLGMSWAQATSSPAGQPSSGPAIDPARLGQVISALTRSTHCYQVLVQEQGRDTQKAGAGDAELFSRGNLTVEKLKDLTAEGRLLLDNPDAVLAWVQRRPATTDLNAGTGVVKVVEDLNQVKLPDSEKLPRNLVYEAVKSALAGREDLSAQAYANIMQDSIDTGNGESQRRQLSLLYYKLGLKVNLRQLGLPGGNMDLKRIATDLSAKMPECPYGWKNAKDRTQKLWMAFTMTETGGEKWTGHGDHKVLGRQMLEDPEIKPLIPVFKAMGERKFVFAGHSCHANHWTTDASWCLIAVEAMQQVNPKIEYVDFGRKYGNGPDSVVKYQLAAILDCKPTDLLLTVTNDDDDQKNMTQIITECKKIGCRVMAADYLWGWNTPDTIEQAWCKGANTKAALDRLGGDFMEFFKLPRERKVPDLNTWEGADGIHMATVGHIFYAKEWLKFLAAREQTKAK